MVRVSFNKVFIIEDLPTFGRPTSAMFNLILLLLVVVLQSGNVLLTLSASSLIQNYGQRLLRKCG